MRITLFCLFLCLSQGLSAQTQPAPTLSGNPIFPGWYADPETALFGKTYWIFPTYSAKYKDQVFFDAFSSPDLVHWQKHPHIFDTTTIRWAE
jgi:hypothetical protein